VTMTPSVTLQSYLMTAESSSVIAVVTHASVHSPSLSHSAVQLVADDAVCMALHSTAAPRDNQRVKPSQYFCCTLPVIHDISKKIAVFTKTGFIQTLKHCFPELSRTCNFRSNSRAFQDSKNVFSRTFQDTLRSQTVNTVA